MIEPTLNHFPRTSALITFFLGAAIYGAYKRNEQLSPRLLGGAAVCGLVLGLAADFLNEEG